MDLSGNHVSEWNHHFHKCILFPKTLPTNSISINTTQQSSITQVQVYNLTYKNSKSQFPIHSYNAHSIYSFI